MKKIRRGLACLLAVLLVAQQVPLTVVHAMTLEEKIEHLKQELEKNKKEQDEAQSEKQDAQNKVNDLKQEENQLGYTYNSLNNQLQGIYDEINSTNDAIATTTSDITRLEQELEQAHAERDAQYEGMKKRIQFMYENGTDSILVSILASGSVAEFVKRAEYASMIANYDREKIAAYDQLQETISAKTEQLQEKKQQLSAYQDSLQVKQGELNGLVGEAGNAYASKKGEVSAAEMTVEEYNNRIATLVQQEAASEQEYAAAQAELAKQ